MDGNISQREEKESVVALGVSKESKEGGSEIAGKRVSDCFFLKEVPQEKTIVWIFQGRGVLINFHPLPVLYARIRICTLR